MQVSSRSIRSRSLTGIATVCLLLAATSPVWALIEGGEGNAPVNDPGWPAGAAGVFNALPRVAYWVGPPFGGGEWHAECRGDAAAFNAVLAAFAKIDAPQKRLVVHDGVGKSFWLNPNRDPAKREAAAIDWTFTVWEPNRWGMLRRLPADLRPRGQEEVPAPQIDLYAGGHVPFADVQIPQGIEVDDRRLEAHGFELTDGVVLDGTVRDLTTKQPLAATIELQRVEPQAKGGYQYTTVTKTAADDRGRWVVKSTPAGWHRVVVAAAGYVPRIAAYGTYDDEPLWIPLETGLARTAGVTGRVTDDRGQPLAGVTVRLGDLVAGDGGRYEMPTGDELQTDADGRFHSDQLPLGKGTVRVYKPGYVRPGLGQPIELPSKDIALTMIKAAALKITVDFGATKRPEGYIVNIAPEDGEGVGKWGGSGNINAENRIHFEQIPPGRYVFYGRPNPGSEAQQTAPVVVDLQGGQTKEITLRAK
jgi:hypothetical protein